MPSLEDSLAVLTRTPAAIEALSVDVDVVRQLIECERNDWMPRARMILALGDAKPFESVDRWAQVEAVPEQSLRQLLDEFSTLRARHVSEVRGWCLTPDQLARRGLHPELGPVTLSELLATWAAVDLMHLHQIARAMAHRYQDTMGPFSKLLEV